MLIGTFNIMVFCQKTTNIMRFIGWVLTIFKILIPFLIIVFGMIDFGKAVVGSKDDEIKNSAKSLGFRIAAGVIIFFIPSLIIWFFSAVTDFSQSKAGFRACQNCLLHPEDLDGCPDIEE